MKKIRSVLCFILTLVTVFTMASVVASAKTVVDLPKTENVRIEMYPKGVNIIWEPTDENLKYQHIIYRSNTGKAGTWKKLTVTEKFIFNYIDETAVMGKKYYYTVKSYLKEEGTSVVHVSEMSGKHKVTVKPARWELSSTTNCGKGVLIKWTAAPSHFDGYIIYKSTENKAGTWTKIATIKKGDVGTYTDNKVSAGETYYYCIKGYKTVNGKNVYGQASPSKKSTIKDVAVPQNLKVEYECLDGKVRITFDKVPATRGYMIYRSESGKAGTWKKIIVTTTNSKTEFYDDTAKWGTKYYYTAKSYKNLNGKNIYSGNAKVATIGPSVVGCQDSEIELDGEGRHSGLRFELKGISRDDIKIFIDDEEFTCEPHEYYEEFFADKPFTFEMWGYTNISDAVEFSVIRKGTGEGTIRVQYTKDENIYAECKIICVASEYDKDLIEAENRQNSVKAKMSEAKKLLEEGYDETTKDTNVAEHKNIAQVKELVLSAEADYLEAKKLLEKHKEDNDGGLDYHDLVYWVNNCESKFLIVKTKLEGGTAKEKTLESTIKYLETAFYLE